jgi:hypothetical protein
MGGSMKNEVIEFAEKIGAKDLKLMFKNSKFSGLFKRSNYFVSNKDTFLVIKISRSKIKNFWGIGKKYIEIFDTLTENSGNYYMVALVSGNSGWVISKNEIRGLISDGSMSFSEKQNQYKLNDYNLKSSNSFTSPEGFLEKINES